MRLKFSTLLYITGVFYEIMMYMCYALSTLSQATAQYFEKISNSY